MFKNIQKNNSNMNFKNSLVYVIALILVIVGMYFIFSKDNLDNDYPTPQPGFEIPKTAIHWHSWLRIVVNGQEQQIPDDIGTKPTDGYISSEMGMAPIHVHVGEGEINPDLGRKIHLENLRPYAKPRTLTVGYFFDVWGKNFNGTCILDYCNSGNKTVKIFVNDKPNYNFGDFYMQDGDRILITYG